jgi:hypothetical protein
MGVARLDLLDARGTDRELDADLREDRPPLGRGGGED